MRVEELLQEFTAKANAPKLEETLKTEIIRLDEKIDTVEVNLYEKIEEVEKMAEEIKKEPGPKGDSYILTQEDMTVIAGKITVPVVEKVVEKVERIETIREIPIVTENKYETIKEIALHETGEAIVNKINELPIEDEFKIDAKHIKNLPEVSVTKLAGGITRGVADSLYAPIGSTGSAAWDSPFGDATFTYDVDGNVETKTVGSTVLTFTYDVDGNVETISDGTNTKTFTYDGSGNVDTIDYT